MTERPQPSAWPRFTLRSADQAAAAGIVLCCLLALLANWWWRGGSGAMLEVERLQPGTIPYVVDLNQADWPEFIVLPGMGETLAKRIVESREKVGPYRSIHDLERIDGIGPRTLERLRPYLKPIAEIEVDSLDAFEATLAAIPHIILLDNMSLAQLREAVTRRNAVGSSTQLEASGGVRLDTIRPIAETGVERISCGALTHSAINFDVALDWE